MLTQTTPATTPTQPVQPQQAPGQLPQPQTPPVQPIKQPQQVEQPKQEAPEVQPVVAENMVDLHFGMLLYIASAFAYASMFNKTAENIKSAPDGHGVFMLEHDVNIPEQVKTDIVKEVETVKAAKAGIDYNNNNLLAILKDNPELLKENPTLLKEVGLNDETEEPEQP